MRSDVSQGGCCGSCIIPLREKSLYALPHTYTMGENQKLEKQEFDVTIGALPLFNTKKQYPRGIISYLLNIILIIIS